MSSTRPRPVNNNPHQQPGGRGGGHQGNNRGGGQGGGGHHHPEPSPWLNHPLDPNPRPHQTASFVEYLRWMRTHDAQHNEGTKVQLVSFAESRGDYIQRLKEMNRRTRLIAGDSNTFTVTCSWRIRVGGTKGPESMLLPAFDALGMPYIPSSTLRGVTRAQGVRELMAQGLSRAEAEKEIAKYFGDLDAEDKHKAGKIIFLDAYPVATDESQSGGLAVDIANNIWSWDGNNPKYSPNPNVFFSLKQAKFLIGIRKGINCTDEMLATVKQWLIKGLAQGVGSQINSGYGRLITQQTPPNPREFLRLQFELKGQLIHGRQTVTWNPERNRFNNHSIAEVRPVAFKNMMRYWFRAFGLGVLPASKVQEWEGKLFGAITPHPQRGWIQVEILDGKIVQQEPRPNNQGRNDPVGQQSGILVLSLSDECPDEQKESSQRLFRNLAWLMFHLGGVGQGARRPCYSRGDRNRAPWWRGSTLVPTYSNSFEKPQDFARDFRQHLERFYNALGEVSLTQLISLRSVVEPTENLWVEAADTNCQIWLVPSSSSNTSGTSTIYLARGPRPGQPSPSRSIDGKKSHALQILHKLVHPNLDEYQKKKNSQNDEERAEALKALTRAKNLCGHTDRDRIQGQERRAIPSPVWIANLGQYEVVTVFGATAEPRKRFVDVLRREGAIQVFPLPQGGNR
jgi:CRISPR-associated protein Cmr6